MTMSSNTSRSAAVQPPRLGGACQIHWGRSDASVPWQTDLKARRPAFAFETTPQHLNRKAHVVICHLKDSAARAVEPERGRHQSLGWCSAKRQRVPMRDGNAATDRYFGGVARRKLHRLQAGNTTLDDRRMLNCLRRYQNHQCRGCRQLHAVWTLLSDWPI